MKKILTYALSIFAFLFIVTNKVAATDYNGKLGYDYSQSYTRFYYLNQRATTVELNIEGLEPISLNKEESGIYYYVAEGNLKDKEYYYRVCYEDSSCVETIDPFAYSLDKDRNRNVILDNNITPLEGWDLVSGVDTNYYNNSIYAIEAHKFVENLSMSNSEMDFVDSVFTRLVANSQYSNINTGYSYLNNLGIKNLEIGNLYDANNYFAANQEYSTKTDNYSANQELKKVILGYKNIKMNVILRTDFLKPQDQLMQTLMNVSSDYIVDGKININNPIMRRYIKDVYKYWVNEYKVDGFYILNADLYGAEYLTELINELKEINKNLFIYTDSITNDYHTSDVLQEVLFGSLENANNEGIINGNYSEENFSNLVNYMFSGYYNDMSKYNEATKVINNIGSFEGIDVYSKIMLLSGLSASETEVLNKVKIGLQTILASAGIPRLIAGNEFLNTTIISSSQINSIPDDKKVCNSSNSLCYGKGDLKEIDWGYLVQNSSNLIQMMIYRSNYQYQFPNFMSMKENESVSYDKEIAKSGLLYLTINYDANYKGDLEKSILLINYSNKDLNISAISDRDYSFIDAIMGKVQGDDDTTTISQYTFFTLSQTKVQKFSNFVYILVAAGLFVFIFGIRALLINLLKVKRGIDYKEYSRELKEQKKKEKSDKKKKKKKERSPGTFETFLFNDPMIKNMGNKIKKDKNKEDKKVENVETSEQEDVKTDTIGSNDNEQE